MGFLDRLSSILFRHRQNNNEHQQQETVGGYDVEAVQVLSRPTPRCMQGNISHPPGLVGTHNNHNGGNLHAVPAFLMPSVSPQPHYIRSVPPWPIFDHNSYMQAREHIHELRQAISQQSVPQYNLVGRGGVSNSQRGLMRINEEQMRLENECEPGFTKRDRRIILAIFTILLTINQAVSSAAGSSRVKIDSCIWQTATLGFVGVFFLIFPWLSKEKDRKYFDSPIPKIGILCMVVTLISFCINFFPTLNNVITRFSASQNPDACTNSTDSIIYTYSEPIYILSWIACSLVMITPLFFSPLLTELINYFTEKVNNQKTNDLTEAQKNLLLLEKQLEYLEQQCQRKVEMAEMKHEISDLKKELAQYKRAASGGYSQSSPRRVVKFSDNSARESSSTMLPLAARTITPRQSEPGASARI